MGILEGEGKNFEEIFGLNKIKMYENIFKEGKKFISFLQKINEQNYILKKYYIPKFKLLL